MSHLKALDRQLEVMGVTDLAAGEIALARGLASLLDSAPEVDWVWREYRFALRGLREVLDGGGDLTENLEAEFAKLDG